jgi:hypothetical protein
MSNEVNPLSMDALPPHLRKMYAPNEQFLKEAEEDVFMAIGLPFSDFHVWTKEKSVYTRCYNKVPGLRRLSGIKSLSFLSYLQGERREANIRMDLYQDRYIHSLLVATLMEEVLTRNEFSEQDVKKGVIAGLFHDIATPALGDATKKIDYKNLDEEKFWWEAIGQEGHDFLNEEGVSRQEVDQIIQNQGTIGKILDVVDRISYTMVDVERLSSGYIKGAYPYKFRYLDSFFTRNLDIGNIYKDIKVDHDSGDVYFEDPKRLSKFLYLRSHLFKYLYMNPRSIAKDFYIGSKIKPLYSEDGSTALSPETLRELSDFNLIAILKQNGLDFNVDRFLDWAPEAEKFDTEDEVLERITELELPASFNILQLIGATYCGEFNPAIDSKIKDISGNVVPFEEANPKFSKILSKMAQSRKGHYLIYERLNP